MYELTKQDFDNILAFSTAINTDHAGFENTVLLSLANYFNLRLTAYISCRRDGNNGLVVEQIFSNSLNVDFLYKYKTQYYLEDPFIKKHFQLCYANSSMTYLTDSHISQEDYRNTSYARQLRQFDIPHEAVIGINGPTDNRVHLVKLYKPRSEGDFTEREKTLFQYIGSIFNSSKMLYMRSLSKLRKLEATSAYWDGIAFGFAILDASGNLIACNSTFMSSLPKLSSNLTKDGVITDIIRSLTGRDRLPEDNYFCLEAHKSGLKLTLQKKRVEYPSLHAENMFFLTIQNENEDTAPVLDAAALENLFGLTRREKEISLLIAKGHSNQEIADELYLSISTVKSHISNIYDKLEVNTRTEAIRRLRELTSQTNSVY